MTNRALRGVIFDLDGTLVLSDLDFDKIRAEIGISERTPILEYLEKQSPKMQAKGMRILEKYERRGAESATLSDGASEILLFLRQHKLKSAIVTRNSLESVQIVMSNLGFTVDAVVTRSDAAPKPSPEPLILACKKMGLQTKDVVFVGDFVFDRDAGANAGIETYIISNKNAPSHPDEVSSLHDIIALLQRRQEIP